MRDILIRHVRRARVSTITGVAIVGLLCGSLLLGNAHALTPAFVQTNFKEVGSGTTDSVAFKSANAAGNLIVVYVAWSSGTSTTSITDTRGNAYASTASPVKFNGSAWSSQMFYAKNVAAGANTVTANFSSAITSFGLVYVHEYSGIDANNPLDVTAGAAGTASAMNSGSATTTSANDLIFGAGCSSSTVTQKGTGFTSRSTGSGNMTEDKIATTAGANSATATQNGSAWVMQMAAFRAAGSTPDTTPPSVPTGLSATAASQTQVNLTWNAATDNVGVTGYKVYRGGTQVGTTTGTSYQDTGLSAGTTYNYSVAAFDAAGNTSAQSAVVPGTTQAPDTTAPSVPAGLTTTTISASEIDLSWSASTDNVGVAGYHVFRNGVQVATVTTTSYKDTGLAAGTQYGYTVSAFDAAANQSAQSATVNGTTQAPDTTPPSTPSGLVAITISTSEIDLGWNAATDNVGVTGYKVYRGGTLVGTTTGAISYKDTALAAGTQYSYTVSAVDAAGNESAQSTAATATTQSPDTTAPSVPTNLSVTGATTSGLVLNWSASTDNVGVAGYAVYRNGSQIATTTNTTYQDSGLTSGTTYTYAVAAFDAAGNTSNLSTAVNGTTQTGSSFPFVASVSANHRYLLDQFGHPYLMVGDSPHSLAANLTEAQATTYFTDRQAHGINSVWMQVLIDGYTGGRSNGATYDGIVPFTTANDFSTPNPAYFQRLSDMVNIAAQHGVTVFLDPLDTAGWTAQYESNGPTKDFNYGVYLGNLFKNASNIVWITGNDYGGWWDATQDNEVTSVAKGIASVDSKHLQTVQLNGTISSSLDDPNWTPIINMNGVYTYYPTYDETYHAYNQTPTMPVYLQEANYEFENNTGGPATTNETLRRQSWWSVTSGAVAGQLYGNSYTWDTEDWATEQAHMDTPGVTQMQYWGNLLESREWYGLVPDQSHTFLTAGMGTYDSAQDDVLQSDYATAAVTPDGTFGLVYVPTARTITVNLSAMSGPVTVRWYDPSNNTYQTVSGSPFASGSGTQQFTTPGTNADGNADWVLVLDGSTAPDTTPPSVPAGLTVTGTTGNTASLSWSAATDNFGVAGYKVYRNGTLVGSTTNTTYTDNGLTPTTTYTYTVAAYDFAGNQSAQSSAVTATTQTPDTTPPAAPTGLMATTISSSEIDLSWSASTDNVGVTGYKVYRNGTLVSSTTGALSFKDTGLSASTAYAYTVTALDAAGNESAQSSTANATTQAPDTTPPSAPTNLALSATTSSTASLSWNAATDNISVTGYHVYRNGVQVSSAGTTSFTDTGLSPSTTYSYTVTAYDAAGNESAQSAAVVVTTAAATVASPTFVQLNSATPQTAQTSTAVTYTQAQTAGDLNVVVVGFYSATGTISSVTDSAGNTYVLAAPLTRQNATSQAIYYAKNIKAAAAGTNTVTVTFSASVPYPDIRVAEYAGLDTASSFDATSSANGFPTTATSGNVTTTKPVELLFGAGTTAGTFTAAGSGYTLRVITNPDSDIVEDRVVTATGTYAATAAQSSDEVMQVVAFKAAGQ